MELALPLTNESNITPVSRESLIGSLPAVSPDSTFSEALRRRVLESGIKVVAIDDDPTGCQTVHDVPLLLEWTVEALEEGLCDPAPALFVLANTRAMPPAAAAEVNRQIARRLKEAAGRAGRRFVALSRSDSTLRGHFPLEPDILGEELGPFDGVLIAPCFFEAGRYTVHGVHWVAQGDMLVPAAQTEFARDPAFGFSHSYLPAWVEEKTGGRWKASDVLVLDVGQVRAEGPAYVTDRLMGIEGGRPVVVDAVEYADLERVVAGLLEAEARGKRFLYRTGASFLRVRAGIAPRPLLTRQELLDAPAPAVGLVAVGSFVPRSTRQLGRLLTWPAAAGVELPVEQLLTPEREKVIARVVEAACESAFAGNVPVIYTSRGLRVGGSPEESLAIMESASLALVEAVQGVLSRVPADFVVAKGGITSHELAQRALGARRTRVLGQIAPGVPVWRITRAGEESRALKLSPGAPYVVFPGNVGDEGTLLEVVQLLRGESAG